MRDRNEHCYEFGPFRLLAEEGELVKDGERVALTRKAFETLLALVERAGHLVEKEALMRRVWPDAVVEEANLANNVSLLRRVLGDASYIETAPGRGYRFVAPVREAPRARAGAPALAVLPFRVPGGRDEEYLGLGFADALITRLGGLRGLRIRPTSAVARFVPPPADALEVARSLRVDAVLEGTIRISGERVRVTAQLVDVAEATPLWTGKFDERLSDIFAVEDSITERIARALPEAVLGGNVAPRDTRNIEAHRLYLKARYLQSKLTRDALRQAIDAFAAVTEIDAGYARAHGGIAECWCWLSHFHVSSREALPRAREAAERALALDAGVAEAHLALGLVRMWYDWDWGSAEGSYQRALEIAPAYAAAHQWYAFDLTILGRHDDAIAHARRALELDPLSLPGRACLCWVLYCARRTSETIEEIQPAIELDPSFYLAHYALGLAQLHSGRPAEAVRSFEEGTRLSARSPEVVAALAHAHAVLGDSAEARRLLGELDARRAAGEVSAYHGAVVRVALGDLDGAFAGLERALAERSEWLVWLGVEPRLDALRRDPRFPPLAERIGTAPPL